MQCGGEMALVWFSTQSSDLKIVHRNHLEFLKKILTPRPHCRKNHIRIHGGGNQESGVIDFPGDCHEQPCQRPPTPWRITFTHVIVLCLWNSPGKNTWMGSHSLLQGSSWPGIEPESPALQADSLLSEPPGKPKWPQVSLLIQFILYLLPFWLGTLRVDLIILRIFLDPNKVIITWQQQG